MEKVKKTLYTLALKGYAPELTNTTFELMRRYAAKIEADFHVIDTAKIDRYPTYEKFQIWDLMRENEDEWSIFFDADTMIHPDFFDVTMILGKEYTCAGYTSDFTPLRFRPDGCFLRDQRWLGKGSWCIICSDWTRDIWHPLDDISYEHAIEQIFPTQDEKALIQKTPESLIDDYVVSRNIARFGLKHTNLSEISKQFPNVPIGVTTNVTGPNGQVGQQVFPFLQHDYNQSTIDKKVVWAEKMLHTWGVTL